jgi:hypothetical protein
MRAVFSELIIVLSGQLILNSVEHLWNICGTFVEHMPNERGTLWNICGTFVEHDTRFRAVNHSALRSIEPQVCGTFVEHLWSTYHTLVGTFVEHESDFAHRFMLEYGHSHLTSVEHLWSIGGTGIRFCISKCVKRALAVAWRSV